MSESMVEEELKEYGSDETEGESTVRSTDSDFLRQAAADVPFPRDLRMGYMPPTEDVPAIRQVDQSAFPQTHERREFDWRPSRNPHGKLESSGRRAYTVDETEFPQSQIEDFRTADKFRQRRYDRLTAEYAARDAESERLRGLTEEEKAAENESKQANKAAAQGRAAELSDMRKALRPFRDVSGASDGQFTRDKSSYEARGRVGAFRKLARRKAELEARVAERQGKIDRSRFGWGNLTNWLGGLFKNRGRRRDVQRAQGDLAALNGASVGLGFGDLSEESLAPHVTQALLEERLPMTEGSAMFASLGKGAQLRMDARQGLVDQRPGIHQLAKVAKKSLAMRAIAGGGVIRRDSKSTLADAASNYVGQEATGSGIGKTILAKWGAPADSGGFMIDEANEEDEHDKPGVLKPDQQYDPAAEDRREAKSYDFRRPGRRGAGAGAGAAAAVGGSDVSRPGGILKHDPSFDGTVHDRNRAGLVKRLAEIDELPDEERKEAHGHGGIRGDTENNQTGAQMGWHLFQGQYEGHLDREQQLLDEGETDPDMFEGVISMERAGRTQAGLAQEEMPGAAPHYPLKVPNPHAAPDDRANREMSDIPAKVAEFNDERERGLGALAGPGKPSTRRRVRFADEVAVSQAQGLIEEEKVPAGGVHTGGQGLVFDDLLQPEMTMPRKRRKGKRDKGMFTGMNAGMRPDLGPGARDRPSREDDDYQPTAQEFARLQAELDEPRREVAPVDRIAPGGARQGLQPPMPQQIIEEEKQEEPPSPRESLTNIPGFDFDEPIENTMYSQADIEKYQMDVQEILKDASPEDLEKARVKTYHRYAQHLESLDYTPEQIANKRVLREADGVPGGYARNDANPDLAVNSGPMTFDGIDVAPDESENDQEHVFDWRAQATGQKLQRTVVAKPDIETEMIEGSSAGLRKEAILAVPPQGWDNVGKKPGLFGAKAAKQAYRNKKRERDAVIDSAWNAMGPDRMPNFIAESEVGRAKWMGREAAQNRTNLFMPLPRDGR